MLSKEIKKLVEISEGKIIISQGNLEESYVVMKLNKYLEEKNPVTNKRKISSGKMKKENGLTDKFFLDKISADLEEICEREREEKLENDFLEKKINDDIDYDYSSERI